jgi:hypothetical protein
MKGSGGRGKASLCVRDLRNFEGRELQHRRGKRAEKIDRRPRLRQGAREGRNIQKEETEQTRDENRLAQRPLA